MADGEVFKTEPTDYHSPTDEYMNTVCKVEPKDQHIDIPTDIEITAVPLSEENLPDGEVAVQTVNDGHTDSSSPGGRSDLSVSPSRLKPANVLLEKLPQRYDCRLCGTSVSFNGTVFLFSENQQEGIDYQCLMCKTNPQRPGIEFRSVIGKLQRKKNEDKAHLCPVCGKRFASKQGMELHKVSHDDVKPFKCTHCDKRYCNNYQVQQHELIHTVRNRSVKRFKCSTCQQKFISKYTLQQHEKRHNFLLPFCCSFCGKHFMYQGEAEIHERKHTGEKPYQCSFCDKTFSSKNNAKKHEVVHTGINKFKCSYCDKSFAFKRSIKDHETTHTGERPYKCPRCLESFKTSSNLGHHRRKCSQKSQ